MLPSEFYTKRRNPAASTQSCKPGTQGSVNPAIPRNLSSIMLKHRRDLRPLLQVLQDIRIPYHWKSPFCLQAMTGNCTALLRTPTDLQQFCDTLGIPPVSVPDWYSAFLQPDPWIPTQPEDTPRLQRNWQRQHRPSADAPPCARGDMETEESMRTSPSSVQ